MTRCFIYGLVCPKSSAVRYVGRTIDTTSRLRAHLTQVDNRAKREWIRGLLAEGLRPNLMVLAECEIADGPRLEVEWMERGRADGWDLLNDINAGGGSVARIQARIEQEEQARLPAAKRGPGRPKGSGTLGARLEIKISPDDKERVESAASAAGLTPAEWVRRACGYCVAAKVPLVAAR